MEYIYSWIPAYKQIVAKLPEYKNRQLELIQVLREIGVNVGEDEDRPDHKVPLTEIDPFTFLFFIGSPKNYWNKIKVLRSLCEKWQINVVVNDVSGIPTANAQKLRLFPWQYDRVNEIARLWEVFDLLQNNLITDAIFSELETFSSVRKTKITEAFFIAQPERFLCINGKVRPYLQSKGINPDFNTYTEYVSLLNRIKTQVKTPFHQLSFESHIYSEYGNHVPSYYRIGTTAGESGKSILPEMVLNNIASIGWEDIGDLNLIEPFNRKHIQKALQGVGRYPGDNSTASRKAGEILQFKEELIPGDFVFAADGATIKAIGVVISEHYVFDANLDFPNCRCVNWLKTDITDLKLNEGLRTSVWQYVDPVILDQIQNYFSGNNISNEIKHNSKNNNMALNTILFGPPGTGKTYCTIDMALTTLGENIVGLERAEVKGRFAHFQNQKRIFFTTFHQNMAYEDFIEGIKPQEPDDDNYLKYEIQDGLFMKACIEATYNFIIKNFPNNNQGAQLLNFNQLYDTLYAQIEQEGERELVTRGGGNIQVSVTGQGNFSCRHVNGTRSYTVSRDRLAPIFEAFPDANAIANIHDEFRGIIGGCNATAFWSVLNVITNMQLEVIAPNPAAIIDLPFEDKKNIVKSYWKNTAYLNLENDLSDPFIFIIDEINRGNVAQIFGELITLIEEDKRLGKPEMIKLDLPYSKAKFCVPPNLYILGTMNTADRSVEALDTALRRRFSFVPKLPEESELKQKPEGIDLAKMLSKINERLRVLKDNDHTIGHAWLWDVKDLEGLRKAFAEKVIPLLQEYFFNDYEKLGLVLGDNFFKPSKQISSDIFAKFSGGNGIGGQYDQAWQYELKPASTLTTADFQSLYQDNTNSTDED